MSDHNIYVCCFEDDRCGNGSIVVQKRQGLALCMVVRAPSSFGSLHLMNTRSAASTYVPHSSPAATKLAVKSSVH